MTESKHDAFVRLAERRTRVVLDKIRILSNCANPYAYEYAEDEVDKIFEAIEDELGRAKARFEKYRRREFRLS